MNDAIRVLIVDDEERFRVTTAAILTRRGFEVAAVGSGIEAIEEIRKDDFDVVVLDVRLNGENGIEVMQKINGINASLPVLLLTGHTCEETSDAALAAGAFDYVCKPVDIEVLIEKMRESIEVYRLGGGKG